MSLSAPNPSHVTSNSGPKAARPGNETPTDTAQASNIAPRAQLLEWLGRLRPGVIRPARGFLRHPYCIPGGYYDQQWDWDGFFIACHLAARTPPLPQYLRYWTLNVLDSELPDGDVAACVTPDGVRTGNHSLRLKPFLAQGAELAARLLGDWQWLRPAYQDIVRIATRRESTHFRADPGLFVWSDAMESGVDNNISVTNERATAAQIAACDASTFFVREYRALARIARHCGHATDQVRFERMARAIGDAINGWLWDDVTCSYWNRDLVTGRRITHVCHTNFMPLWAGLASRERAVAMIERYLWNEQHLLSPFGLRTLSRQDPDYNNANIINPYSNWQGPVWPIANYFYLGALVRYGFRAEAADLGERLTRLYLNDLNTCGSLHENYDAETGAPLAPSAAQSPANEEGGFIGWNLLLQDMIEMSEGKPDLLDLPPAD